MNKKKWLDGVPFWQIIITAVLLRILSAVFIPQALSLDNYQFIKPWMDGMSLNGVLNMYTTVTYAPRPVDYPPLYYTVMYYTVGWISARIEALDIASFVLRLFPLTMDIVAIFVIYRLFGERLSLFWASSFLLLYDSIALGQSDSLLMFEFLLLYYAYTRKSGVRMGVMFAVMCLTKLQGCYFLPVYLYMLYDISVTGKAKIKTAASSLASGAFTGAAVWMPWALHYGDVLYPVKFYLNTFSMHNELSQLAPNLGTIAYFLTQMRNAPEWYGAVNKALLLLFMLIFIALCLRTKRVLFSASVYFFCIFMFTLNQHPRYPIYFLILLMLSSMLEKELPRRPIQFMAANEAAILIIRSIGEYAFTLNDAATSTLLGAIIEIDVIECTIFFLSSEWHIIKAELFSAAGRGKPVPAGTNSGGLA